MLVARLLCYTTLAAACVPSSQPSSTSDVDLSAGTELTSTSSGTTTGEVTTGTPTTTTGVIMGGPCDGLPNDAMCMCRPTDKSFCALLDTYCRVDVGLDLSMQEPPGTDHCDVLHDWCVSDDVSTYAVCYLLESTCTQVAPSGNPADCAGLGDTCACDDFEQDGAGGEAGDETSGGSGSETFGQATDAETGVEQDDAPTLG